MRLLVTRPEPDASETADTLRQLGHDPLVAPLLTVTFAPPPHDLPAPGAVVVTSRNGVRALEGWAVAETWRGLPVFATGAATGRALEALGFADIRVAGGDVRSLKETIHQGVRREAGPIVYPAARDRAGALEGDLAARGYDVHAVVAYRADPVAALAPETVAALRSGTLDGVLIYSRRTATTLRDLAAAAQLTSTLAEPTYYVISENVAGVVRAFAPSVAVAAAPDEDSVLALLG